MLVKSKPFLIMKLIYWHSTGSIQKCTVFDLIFCRLHFGCKTKMYI